MNGVFVAGGKEVCVDFVKDSSYDLDVPIVSGICLL